MVKAAGIRNEDTFSTLKALFPIFAGICFLGLIIYITSIYSYQNSLNTYFVLNEDRNSLENIYLDGFTELTSTISSLKDKRANEKVVILDDSEDLNGNLLQYINQMIVDGYKILELGISEREQYDLTMNELNFFRLQLHTKISEYLDRQKFAVNYIKYKSSTETCYNKIKLNSSNYAKVVSALNNCSEKLNIQIEYIDSSSFDSETFKKTSEYLDKYESYWNSVKQMFTLLTKGKDEQAKKTADEVKDKLRKLPTSQESSQEELNSVLSEDVQKELSNLLEEINNKMIDIEALDKSTSF